MGNPSHVRAVRAVPEKQSAPSASGPDDDGRLVVHLTTAQLHEVVRQAVAAALAMHHPMTPSPEPMTVSGAEMAARIGISRSTMHELRARDGCPAVRIGDHHRFEPEVVMAWLRAWSTP